MYCEHRLQYWNSGFSVDVVVNFLSQEILYFILFFNPFAPEPPVTARADPGTFYPL